MTEPSHLVATRTAYDTVATDYAGTVGDWLDSKPLDRALITVFADLVLASGTGAGSAGPVADVGCGPGHVTAHLRSLGLDAFGIDLSSAMVATARRAHPDLRFEEGAMAALELPDAALAGILARYSIIHTPPEQLPTVFAEFHRVLAPGGHLLLAFQVGDERRHIQQGYGHAITLDAYRLPPDRVADLLRDAGLPVVARLFREPDATEKVPQCTLIARRP